LTECGVVAASLCPGAYGVVNKTAKQRRGYTA